VDPDSGSAFHQIQGAKPIRIRILVRLLRHKNFKRKNAVYGTLRQVIKYTYVGTKAFLKDWDSGLFVYLSLYPCSWNRIRIRHSQYGSRSRRAILMQIRIRYTAFHIFALHLTFRSVFCVWMWNLKYRFRSLIRILIQLCNKVGSGRYHASKVKTLPT
jgi:hypothetical protein